MQFFYTIGIYFYLFLVRLVSPFHYKARLWLRGRKNVFCELEEAFRNNKKPTIWMHVSSLGEFEQGRPLIEQIKKDYSGYKIVLSFFSPSGYEIRKNYELADTVIYLPIDTAQNAKRFLNIVKPSKIFFVKYDFWYYYLREASVRKIPTYLISALFRKKQLFFKFYGGFYRKMLHFFTIIFVQNQESKDLLETIGYDNAIVAGDTRVDRVATLAEQVEDIPHIARFKGRGELLVAGSTWQPDEEMLVPFLKNHLGELPLKVVIAPHQVEDSRVQQLGRRLNAANISYKYYSTLSEKDAVQDYDVLVIDSIGLLSSLYQYADVAYIGGGFGAGIHNTLEPAAFGVPIIFGKKYEKFTEAVALIEQGGAFSVNNYSECEIILSNLFRNKDYRKEAGDICKAFIDRQKGVVSVVVSHCFSVNC